MSGLKRRAVIFDIGGVLLDWSPHYLYRQLLPDDAAIDRFLHEIDFVGWNLQQDGGRSFADGVAALSAQYPHYAPLIRAYDERWAESIRGPIWPTVDVLWALKERGLRVYGLSNFSVEKYQLMRARYAFFSWFDDVIVSGEVRLLKPDPRIFEVCLARIGCAASECVYIDDVAANVAAADRLGLSAIRFTSPAALAADLDRLGVLRLNGRR